MEITLTEFRRNVRAARAAADRGETVTIKSGASNVYVFKRAFQEAERPFADLEPLFGVVRRMPKEQFVHEIVPPTPER